MANQVTLTFAGDADDLAKAAKKASDATEGVGKAASASGKDMESAAGDSGKLLDNFSKLGNAVSGASDAIDGAAGTLDALNQVQQASYQKSQRQQRALNDVAQAQEDVNQAFRDGQQANIDSAQATIDATQANLDAATALKQYKDDVKEFGANSAEAKQDLIDQSQAQLDLKQANEDGAQAIRDASQATIDAKGAQLDLNDAQREANPPDLEKWSQAVQTYAPLLQGLVGITGLITAAQWAWNAAQAASPTTWIIAGILLLIGVIVLIATKTDWFQKAWRASWGWIKNAASNTWDFIKKIPHWISSAFSVVARSITAPFRAAFNFIADAWNHTVGALSFTFPGWIPGIGGNTVSVPNIPKFHSGGVVPGAPGSEMLAVLQAGETVSPTQGGRGSGGNTMITIDSRGSKLDELLVEVLSKAIRNVGGNVQRGIGGRNARTA